MTEGPRASTERKEDQREVRGKMTLTVEYSEMTAKIAEHFKITATTSANWGIPARTQEEYKQKKNFSPRPHAHSHAFRHIRTLTNMTVSTHAYLYSSHTSWEKKKRKHKNPVHALLLKKNQCKTGFYLKRVREVPVKPKVKVSEGNRCSNYSGRVRLLSRRVHLTWLSTPSRKCWVTDFE